MLRMLAQSKSAALVAALLQTRSLLLWCGLRLRCMCPIQGAAAAWLHCSLAAVRRSRLCCLAEICLDAT